MYATQYIASIITNFLINDLSSSPPNKNLAPKYKRTVLITEQSDEKGLVIVETFELIKVNKLTTLAITIGNLAAVTTDITVIKLLSLFLFKAKIVIDNTNIINTGATADFINGNKYFKIFHDNEE